jgi:hypothetical protein
MDAPGFPAGPGTPVPALLVWLVVLVVLAAGVMFALTIARRSGESRNWLVPLAVSVVGGAVVVVMLLLPASAHVGTDTEASRAECPLSTVDGSFMGGDKSSRIYQYWKPCVSASRTRLGVTLGLYAAVVGSIVVATHTSARRAHLLSK